LAGAKRGEREPATHGNRNMALVTRDGRAPAVRGSGGGEAAGVRSAGTERGEGEPPTHGDRHKAPVVRRVAAQLARRIEAPAVRGSTGGESAGVDSVGAGADQGEGDPTGHGHRDKAAAGRAVPALTLAVGLPATGPA